MTYQVSFGTLGSPPPARAGKGTAAFRIAVLGDFSARANGGTLETGDDLAARKPLRVDVDNLDDVIGRLGIELNLPLDDEGATVQVPIGSMDDFHPDQLYEALELFSEMAGLRRRLTNSSTFKKAAAEVQAWQSGDAPRRPKRRKAKARGAAVPVNGKLSDFARLVGRPTAADRAEASANDLVRRLVGPFVVPAKDPRQDALLRSVDDALSETMRLVLHHPDFQTLEALWRSVDLLVRRLETGANLKIVLYDITAEEIAADLSATDELESTGLYKLLVEQPALDAQQGPLSVLIGNYTFEQTPPHAELLGRMARIAAAAQAPFLAAIGTDCLEKVDPDEVHPLVRESWTALKGLSEAAYVGLAVPRFLLRRPYGQRSDPIDPFEFEEFTPQNGLRGMLWGHPAVLAGLLLGKTFEAGGLKGMKLGSMMTVDDMPYHYYTDPDGDQIPLPCTERLLPVRAAEQVTAQRFMPLVSVRGRPEVRLGSFQSLAGSPLAGPWGSPPAAKSSAAAASPAAAEEAPADTSSDTDESDLSSEAASDSSAGDPELDALLAGLGGDESESSASKPDDDDSGMDPELAALLADL